MSRKQPAAKITVGQRIRFTTADGTQHTITVARVTVQDVYVHTANGRRFAFLGYEQVEVLDPNDGA